MKATDNTMRAEYARPAPEYFPMPDGRKDKQRKAEGERRNPARFAAYTALQLQAAFDAGRADTARQVAGWQPIATAPKDGTNVLLVNRRGNMATGLWMESLSGTGWYLRGSSRGPDAFFNDHHGPTHWMPLPAPPTDASQNSKPDREPSEG